MSQVQLFNVLNSFVCAIKSWGTSSNPLFVSGVTGTVETPTTIENVYVPVTNLSGTTPTGVKSFSIMFEGTGGELNGVPVVSGYINEKSASLGNTLASEMYTIPTTDDPQFAPNTARVVISYVE